MADTKKNKIMWKRNFSKFSKTLRLLLVLDVCGLCICEIQGGFLAYYAHMNAFTSMFLMDTKQCVILHLKMCIFCSNL